MNKHQRISLFVLLLAGFVTIFDLFVVNVAIISIERSLNANLTELTLIIVGYELAFGLLLITGGRLGDIFGKRMLYRVGMLFFIISSALCAVAPTATLLVIARFIQGLSSAILFPQVYSSIRINFNELQAKKAFGYLGMTLGLAAIAGQALGGGLITLNLFGMSWRVIFLINIPIGAFALILSHFLSEGKKIKLNLDWWGVVLSSLGIGSVLVPFLMLPVWGWGLISSGLFVTGGLLLGIFVYYENHLERIGKMPLFSMKILLNSAFVIGLFVVMCIYATSSAFPLLLSILLQNGLGLTPLASGLIFVPASIGFVLSSFMTPRWINRYGDKTLFLGAILYGVSYCLLIIFLLVITLEINIYLFMPLLLIIGFTQGMVMTPLLNLVLSKVHVDLMGMASGFTATLQQVGAAMGATAVSVILQYGLLYFSSTNIFEKLRTAISLSLTFNIVMSFCAALLLYFLVRRVPFNK
ncbi:MULTISPECIES: MFS transporter [Providencia]|uniref:MFS transporter n=2 Tax=Morganellaceae TaxID=1903414 RepID=UPI0008385CF5|nr:MULTISPECIES: MFS transporter [Providencia]MBP6121362.1 MFS transporter [Providencia sp.]NIH22749.1 MFS transporter [Providencia heimbachae]